MWKKEDVPGQTPAMEPDAKPRPDRSGPVTTERSSTTERAAIGRSITIRGDVTGDEDLLIQGRVDGSVNLQQHAVTVGSEGDVKASISGRVVVVEGRVEGDITSDEQVVLRSSAVVTGDITAPRVVLEDGARFRGGVDMGDVAAPPRPNGSANRSQAKRPEETTNAAADRPEKKTAKETSGSETAAEVAG